jgi:4-amino-4-deoxy-L-arabinose transferase-like glycosyltransferase
MTSSTAASVRQRFSWVAVPWPVLLIAGLMFVGLMALAGAYGFHGDEVYFVVAGQHPAFGYVDQPPLTPLPSAASVALFGTSPTAVRLLPALEMGLIVILSGRGERSGAGTFQLTCEIVPASGLLVEVA